MASKHSVLAALLILASGGLSPAWAQKHGLKVVLDPSQTVIRWSLNGDLHNTHGTFKLKTGQLIFDPETGVAEGEILVDATTGESGDKARDKKMQDEVLESGRYPAIFFHPSQLKGAYKDTADVQDLEAQGTFNIHGADHPLSLPLKVKVTAGTVTANTQFDVPYVEWGMKNPSKFLVRVGKQVHIDVAAKGTLAQAD